MDLNSARSLRPAAFRMALLSRPGSSVSGRMLTAPTQALVRAAWTMAKSAPQQLPTATTGTGPVAWRANPVTDSTASNGMLYARTSGTDPVLSWSPGYSHRTEAKPPAARRSAATAHTW